MAQQNINVGTNPNDGTGDSLRNGFIKTNDNFTELYSDKENTANKSATTTLGTSDVLFPTQNAVKTYVDNGLSTKQNTLVSGTNIKTINGNSILGSGDLTITGGISGSGTDNYIPRFNGTTALENSILFDNGTNVGVGTASPVDKLDVNGSLRLRGNTANFTAVNNSGVIDYVPTSIFPTDPQMRIVALGSSTVGASILFQTGTNSGTITERMRLTSEGKFGIGTSNPTAKLQVEGDFYVYDTNQFEVNSNHILATDGLNGFVLESGFTRVGNTIGSSDFTGIEIDGSISVFKAVNTGVNYKFGMKTNENSLYTTENMLSNSGPSDTSSVYKWLRLTDENDVVYYFPLYV